MKLLLSQIIEATQAVSSNCTKDLTLHKVQTDSRLVKPGDIFICLEGDRFDGHNFLHQVAEKGAAAVIVHRPFNNLPSSLPVLLVRDTRQALMNLARYWRLQTKAQVIGITGSAGKTTFKEMLALALSKYGKVGKNYKNWNNQIGLSLSLLNFEGNEDYWILEVGISQPQDMYELGATLLPDKALILNVGPCHTQGLGSLQDVAAAKASLLDFLQPKGTGLVNQDYLELVEAVQAKDKNIVYFSCRQKTSDFYGEIVAINKQKPEYRLYYADKSFSVEIGNLPLLENITALFAMLNLLNIENKALIHVSDKFTAVEQRFVVNKVREWTFIDDTYNANPLSMSLAVKGSDLQYRGQDLIFVLGYMGELGDFAEQAHEDLGALVAKTRCKNLFFYGERYLSALRKGLADWPGRLMPIQNPEYFVNIFKSMHLNPGIILFKGSRSCKMENFMQLLLRRMEK